MDYVIKELDYSLDSVENSATIRLTGKEALETADNVICQNYVDAFVTLARSADVPARAVSGYAFPDTDRIDELPVGVLHSWVEIWDESKGWIAMDPTWEDTSLLEYRDIIGIGHMRWVTYGYSSTEPALPVGYNVIESQGGLNTVATLSEVYKTPNPNLVINADSEITLNPLVNNSINFSLKNTGNVALSNLSVTLGDTQLNSEINQQEVWATEDEVYTPIIVPYSNQNFEVSIDRLDLLEFNNREQNILFGISAEYGDQKISKESSSTIIFQGIEYIELIVIVGIILLLFTILLIAFAARSILIKRGIIKQKIYEVKDRKATN